MIPCIKVYNHKHIRLIWLTFSFIHFKDLYSNQSTHSALPLQLYIIKLYSFIQNWKMFSWCNVEHIFTLSFTVDPDKWMNVEYRLWTPLRAGGGRQSAARLPPKGNDNCRSASSNSSSSQQQQWHRDETEMGFMVDRVKRGGSAESAAQLRMFKVRVSRVKRWSLFCPTCLLSPLKPVPSVKQY